MMMMMMMRVNPLPKPIRNYNGTKKGGAATESAHWSGGQKSWF